MVATCMCSHHSSVLFVVIYTTINHLFVIVTHLLLTTSFVFHSAAGTVRVTSFNTIACRDMEMYAPSFDSCLDPRLGMPETLEEVLLNRTSFTQAYVEQQSKLNEQKFLALSRNFELFKTRLEQTQLLRNNEIEARITNIEGKVEKCMRQISGILDRLVDCESLTNVKTSLNTKFNTLQSKINEQSEYFEMNTNEIVKRVVAAIKEEQQGRQAFEESIRSEKNELTKNWIWYSTRLTLCCKIKN